MTEVVFALHIDETYSEIAQGSSCEAFEILVQEFHLAFTCFGEQSVSDPVI